MIDTEAIRRVVRQEEQERLAGIIEFYIMHLDDSYDNKVVTKVLRSLIKMVERNYHT